MKARTLKPSTALVSNCHRNTTCLGQSMYAISRAHGVALGTGLPDRGEDAEINLSFAGVSPEDCPDLDGPFFCGKRLAEDSVDL